jgi:hypothetical protein
MGRRLFNFTLLVLLGPLFVTFAYEGALFLVSVFTLAATTWFLVGVGLSLVAYLLLQKNVDFIEHLLHELEHAVVAFFFTFQWPKKMEINPEQGSKVEGSLRGGCLTGLAPYYFPLLTVPLLLIKGLAALAFHWCKIDFPNWLSLPLDLLIGATLAFHLVTTLKEFRPGKQTDIKKEGPINSFVAVLFANLIFIVLTIAVVTNSYAELWAYVKSAAAATLGAYQVAYEFVQVHLLPAAGKLVQWVVDRFSGGSTATPVP